MTTATQALEHSVLAVRDAWAAAAAGSPGVDAQSDVDAMTDAGLLAVNEALCALRRQVDGVHARVAAGIAERSRPERGREGLARQAGHRSPTALIAATTGGHAGDASRLIQVGEATQQRSTFSGVRAPAKHPIVAEGLQSGSISIAAAAAIGAMLDRIVVRVGAVRALEAERALVAQAALLTLAELSAVLRRTQAYLDPDGLEPIIEGMHDERSLRFSHDAAGMLVMQGRFDPESGAPIKAAIEALVTQQLRASRGANRAEHDGAVSPVADETRSIPQMNADALAAICRHAIGCDDSTVPAASATVVVRMSLETLQEGTGIAEIDGTDQPIDASTARRLASAANVIPCVLGTDSEILDFGRTRRLFTPAQRLVLVERDGGCAFCHLPPSMTEAHHIRWWMRDAGATNLRNGILLCTACHHRVHAEQWQIRIDPPPPGDATGDTVYFIPPAHIDPDRTPRLGGRKRFDAVWRLVA